LLIAAILVVMTVTLRLADTNDTKALERLAGLDSSRLPSGPHLLAEREGRIDAALSLATGELLADPFRHTTELGELLRAHARSLRAARRPPSSPRPTPRSLPVPT
jgi:hypothetical protein